MKKNWLDKLYENSIEYLRHPKKHLKEYFWAIMIVLFIRSTVGVVYQIPTGSMIPTFKVGDTLVANRFYYGLKIPFTDEKEGYRLPAVRDPEVGDIVVFRGPQEENFYQLIVDYNPNQQALFNKLNKISSFKRLISRDNYEILEGNKNYIILHRSQGNLWIRLHEKIYQQYKKEINKLTIHKISEQKIVMTYKFSNTFPFYKQIINTPVAGLSIISTVLLRTPYFFIYQKALTMLFPNLINRAGRISIYPNPWIDSTKEYVKRIIAKGGDKVEVKNKVVYVNDQKLTWGKLTLDKSYQKDEDEENFYLTQETLPHSPKSEKKDFQHTLRISDSLSPLQEIFNADGWPYDTHTQLSSQYRDVFGPITVPQGHYFMMGDNRDESLDSRYIGTVPKTMITGTPMFIFFPWSRKGTIQ